MKRFIDYLLESKQLKKDEISLVQEKDIKEAFESLKKMIASVQDDYAKCLAVLNLFDDHSVGTLSEKILAYFINSKFASHAKVLAGNANLTDIQVKTSHGWFNLSIKTTDSNDTVNLGTMEKVTEKTKSSDTVSQLKKHLHYKNAKTYDNMMVKDLNNEDVNNRIVAIVEKLCGTESNPEVFCWIKKTNAPLDPTNKKSVNVLKSLKFDIRKFNKKNLADWFSRQYIHLTDNAYGIKTKDGKQVVGADLKGKYLNIRPEFLNAIVNEKGIVEASSSSSDNSIIVLDDIIEPIQKIQKKYIGKDGQITIDDAFIKAIQSLYK